MKRAKLIILLTGFSLWLVAAWASAEVWIKNLSLEKKGEFVAVRIYGSQGFQFTHATEDPKNGKPFRIFVDCQDANFGLSQNNYFDLPGQTVVGIRTSQYQVSPSKIVRVVLDCIKPVSYKVSHQENWIELSIASPDEPAFARWEAAGGSQNPPSAVATKPASPPAVTTVQPQTKANNQTPLTFPPVTVKAETPKPDLVKKETTSSPQTKPTTTAATNVKSTTPPVAKTPEQTKPTSPQIAKTDTPSKSVTPAQSKTSGPQASKPAAATGDMKSDPTTPPPALTQEPSTATVIEQKPLVLAQKTEAEQWVGYPKREKVKYSTQGKRDPFSPLFDQIENAEFGVAPLPSVENLNLVGILQSFDQSLALLEDSRGFGYILQAGDRVKDGRVLRVAEDHVIFQVTEYGWTRNVSLELYNQTK